MTNDSRVAIALATLALLGTLWMELTHNDRENAVRIATLEAHQVDGNSRLDKIESKIDKLVEWALGGAK